MTDPAKIQELKDRIKIIIGDAEYLTFMARFSGSTESVKNLAKSYGLEPSTLTKWANVLGYRDGKTKQALRGYYRRLEKIRERDKRTKKLMNYLFKVNGK